MAPFPFLQRESLAELARHLQLQGYTPTLELEGLLTGIDNLRHDVYLSPKFVEVAREHINRLIARDGQVEDLLKDNQQRSGDAPPQIFRPVAREDQKQPGTLEFKPALADLLVESLNHAKKDNKPSLDILLRVAVVKFFRSELLAQYAAILEKLRVRQAEFEGPGQHQASKAVKVRERVSWFQLSKKPLLRKSGEELFQTLREVDKESLVRMRRALFGGSDNPAYGVLLNRLMFTEDGRDDAILAEHYVMLGNFDRDPDRFGNIESIARSFLGSLGLPALPGREQPDIDPLLNVPDNAHEMVAGGTPDDSTTKGKAQKALLAAWLEALESTGTLEYIIAAYETSPMLAEYSPVINAQQLKGALISKTERGRVEQLLEQHGRMSRASFDAAVRRVARYTSADKAKVAGRFMRDYIRYHRDLRSFEELNAAFDRVNILSNDRLRELSAINNTLYEFLLPSEQKKKEDKVVHHVILKADIRDSTTLTRTLFERGLNPASYFSLNFYDPINKLLPKYEASKVFIEGDAVILAMFGYEGKQEFPVARTCVMAREMISIVRAYNDRSQADGLPTLELGIGISFQDSAPLYLMDGSSRIMISKALNESDRLSGCNKGARRFITPGENLFNVYSFKTVEDEDTGGNPDEFLMRYNVGGIHLNESGFRAMQLEITFDVHEVPLPTLWGEERVRLYSGLVPLGGGIFHLLVLREARIGHVDASDFSFKSWTDRRYYEVCTNQKIYDYVEQQAKANSVGDHSAAGR
jgi:hypothetical protein